MSGFLAYTVKDGRLKVKFKTQRGYCVVHTYQPLEVTAEQIDSWLDGELIQHAMPGLSPGQREMFISGTTDDDWDECFRGDDDVR